MDPPSLHPTPDRSLRTPLQLSPQIAMYHAVVCSLHQQPSPLPRQTTALISFAHALRQQHFPPPMSSLHPPQPLLSASRRECGRKTHPIKPPLARTSHEQILGQTAKTNPHSVAQTLALLLPVTMFVFWGIASIGFHASVYRVPINAHSLASYIRPCIAFKACMNTNSCSWPQ